MPELDWRERYEIPVAGSPRRRIANIRHAIQVVTQRLALGTPCTTPLAVVGSGPSLGDTWEQIKGFSHVLTVSGAHQFLIERGIIPTWHVEVDTRAHKTQAMGPPHHEVKYLVGCTVSPAFLQHLQGHDVTLFHPLSKQPEIIRELPRGEWCVAGGGSVGNKALVIARMLGFRDIHAFGFDSCLRDGVAHAHPHPNPPLPGHLCTCTVEGRTFETTKPLLAYAQSAIRVTDKVSDATFTFYGDGLLQTMFKLHIPSPDPSVIAAQKPLVVTPGYRDLLRELHTQDANFGNGGSEENRDRVVATVTELKTLTAAQTVLDYGCGKGSLADDLDFPIWEYDPAVPGKDRDARPADLVVCTDVLEHIEPECLPGVLQDLKRVTQKVLYAEIRLTKAKRVLPDGRNTHLVQESATWWRELLDKYVTVVRAFQVEEEETVDVFLWAIPKQEGSCDSSSATTPESPSRIMCSPLVL